MKGYKVFKPDFTANYNAFQFAENSEFEVDLPIEICKKGFHFCLKAIDCFTYYKFDASNIVCEVEALGIIETHAEDSKVCTNHIRIGRKLLWTEVLTLVNVGSNNSGDRNSGDCNSGAFCTDNNPNIFLFDKLTNIRVKDWQTHRAMRLMREFLTPTIWIDEAIMTDEEKKLNSEYETTKGYLRVITLKEAWAEMWSNLSAEDKKVFLTLPNFNAEKFEYITGIKTNL